MTAANNECPIMGQDHNLYSHRALSCSSADESSPLSAATTRRDSLDEPSFAADAPEQLALLTSVSSPASALRDTLSSASSEDADLDEVYPHHKKFRLHRKRQALTTLTDTNRRQATDEASTASDDSSANDETGESKNDISDRETSTVNAPCDAENAPSSPKQSKCSDALVMSPAHARYVNPDTSDAQQYELASMTSAAQRLDETNNDSYTMRALHDSSHFRLYSPISGLDQVRLMIRH